MPAEPVPRPGRPAGDPGRDRGGPPGREPGAADPPDGAADPPGAGTPARRLRLTPPADIHAPRLLGLDAAGGEHPQGPHDPDDESLVGRVWGCTCGWRGTVRDITTRHFRPQVGDRGGLRRRRLARADREARGELEGHLTAAGAAPRPATSGDPAPDPCPASQPEPGSGSPRPPGGPRRRRLTLPRRPTAAAPTGDATEHPAPPPAAGPADRCGGERPAGTGATAGASPAEPPGPERSETAERSETPETPDALGRAAQRARRARAELQTAEADLDAAVAAARRAGASWRSIARLTGIPHREAAARWGPAAPGSSL